LLVVLALLAELLWVVDAKMPKPGFRASAASLSAPASNHCFHGVEMKKKELRWALLRMYDAARKTELSRWRKSRGILRDRPAAVLFLGSRRWAVGRSHHAERAPSMLPHFRRMGGPQAPTLTDSSQS
jgi:hypothetical protein